MSTPSTGPATRPATDPIRDYVILLPPSEGKAPGGDASRSWPDVAEDPRFNAFPELNPARLALIQALHEVMQQPRPQLEKLFGVKGPRLDQALATNRQLPGGPLRPAMERYTGVMFEHLDYPGMPPALRQAFDRHALLFSGVWGLLRPTDWIPDYKLKMDAILPATGRVSDFWKPRISGLLNPLVAGAVVWDLLPGVHRRAWDGQGELAARWQVKFVERVTQQGQSRLRTVSHWSKALKGALVRFICQHRVTQPQALADFQHPQGYRFSLEASQMGPKGGTLVFIKEG